MSTTTLTLTDFLLARIAEDEEVAASSGARWRARLYDGAWQIIDTEDDEVLATVEYDHDWSHIARHDPARVLAECEAKLRIVEEHGHAHVCIAPAGTRWDRVLTLLALVYAGHPDYREEWRP